MDIIDYGQSWVTTTGQDNQQTRFWVESRLRVIDEQNGTSEDFYQCGACKSEDTYGKGTQLFYDNNYDFLPIFTEKQAIFFRRRVTFKENYRQIKPIHGRADSKAKIDLVTPPIVQELVTNAEILAGTHQNLPMVSQTEIRNEQTGLSAIIEAPVKTMNIIDGPDVYQIDDGPIIFPDLSKRHENPADGFKLAFIAFSKPDIASFVCEVPTPIIEDGKQIYQIHHYSELLSIPAKNRIFSVGKLK